MRKHSRRRFIGQLLATAIGSTGLNSTASATIGPYDDGLTELCVIAREPGTLPNAVIDVWTGQIGTVDLAQLPDHLGRVVVWDDIRGDRCLSRDVADILVAIEEYFGIKPDLGVNAMAHAGHSGGLSRSLEMLLHTFQPNSPDAIERRIAVIDLSSCGLTRLRWLDVIPLLRRYYTHVVGVDCSCPDLCELDAEFEPPHGLTDVARETMGACDHWLLASEASSSDGVELSPEQRSLEFTRSICDLCEVLAFATRDIDAAVSSFAERRFAMYGAGV